MATLKLKYGVISTDEHVQEAPDVWTNRMSRAKFGDDIPHVMDLPDGTQRFVIRGKPGLAGAHPLAIVDAATTPRNTTPCRWEDVPRATYVPSERLKAMDRDGVDTNTFFPNVAGLSNNQFQREGGEEFRLACIRAYNDWLIDEWVSSSPRFIAQCITPMWSVELAVAEILRSVKRGHKAVIWHGAPEVLGLPHLSNGQWDPIYQVCSDLGVPLCLHVGGVPGGLTASPETPRMTQRAMVAARAMAGNIQVVLGLLFSGVLERFPALKVSIVESGVGWLPHVLERADVEYESARLWDEGLKTRPSELFRRQVWATFWLEHFGIRARRDIGLDNIVYSTDFPHFISTWPNSALARERMFHGVPERDRRRILIENPVRLLQLDVDMSA